MTRIIDVHNDLYPREWLAYLEKRTEFPKFVRTGPDSLAYYWEGVTMAHVRKAGHYDPEARIQDMDRGGIDTQIISLTGPGVELLPVDEGVMWAQKINDYFAELGKKYPGRFYAFANLPYQDVGEALKELDRAYKKLGMKGILLFSNINGKTVASPEFHPIYAKAEEYNLPVFVHPGVPLTAEVMKKVQLPFPLYAFTLDTTMAVVGLIFQGVLEKFPRLKIIHAHLGAMVPYFVVRMDNAFKNHARQWGLDLPLAPSEYYKRQVYIDSISYFPPAMRCALDFVGAEHILLGSDYAHPDSDLERAVSFVREMGLPEEATGKILGGNAVRIFDLQ